VTGSVAAAADAYVWGYPLVTMHRTCAAHGGVGRGLVAMDRLSTAADRTVVAPNNDTLYASGWYDLRTGDLTVDVGAMDPGRYWSVMVLDAYTHVAYVCRRLHGCTGAHVRVTHDPGTQPVVDVASDVIPVGTSTVWVLARVVVDGPGDLPAARRALSRIQVRQPPAPSPPRRAGRAAPRRAGAAGFFRSLAAALAVDPPAAWHPPPPPGVEALLADLPEADVLADAAAEGEARIAAGTGADRRGNGWATRARGADFGDDVDYRASFAKVSLAGHLPAENRSYTRAADGSTTTTLRFPLGDEPQVGGFWSLTVYGRDLFLVENELGRYSIGDRTPGLRRDADGSLPITIGHQRPDDTSNWLPAPAGPCYLALRAYEGHAAVVEARWFPPDLTPAATADPAPSTHAR
jgi:hypothetical protein